MSVIINNEEYDIDEGIRYLKTIYTTDYKKLPKELKHKEVKDNWDKYEGISKKLYLMSKSEDVETVQLAKNILEENKIEAKYTYWKDFQFIGDTRGNHLVKTITIFKTKKWNN